MFVERYGDRDFAKNYVIMLTGEGDSRDPFAAATEACQLQVRSKDSTSGSGSPIRINQSAQLL